MSMSYFPPNHFLKVARASISDCGKDGDPTPDPTDEDAEAGPPDETNAEDDADEDEGAGDGAPDDPAELGFAVAAAAADLAALFALGFLSNAFRTFARRRALDPDSLGSRYFLAIPFG
jgi:hypothetical protein